MNEHARRGITETVVLLACEAYRTEAMKPVVRGVDCMRAALEAIAPHLALTPAPAADVVRRMGFFDVDSGRAITCDRHTWPERAPFKNVWIVDAKEPPL